MSTTLSRTASVLERAATSSLVFFHRPDGEEDGRRRNLGIDVETWAELGSPEEITVTIEPGNTL